jgi:hypothetical protein
MTALLLLLTKMAQTEKNVFPRRNNDYTGVNDQQMINRSLLSLMEKLEQQTNVRIKCKRTPEVYDAIFH